MSAAPGSVWDNDEKTRRPTAMCHEDPVCAPYRWYRARMTEEPTIMAMRENVEFELAGRFRDLGLGKTHISVRYEPEGRIVRVGACITNYNWDTRDKVLDALLEFEDSHAGEFSLEFDIVPLEAVTDPNYVAI